MHIWIINSKSELLIQKRPDHLKHLPGIWAATGGAVIQGEDSKTAACREAKEELGVDIHKSGSYLFKKKTNNYGFYTN